MKKTTAFAALLCLALVACQSVDIRGMRAQAEKSGVCPVHHEAMVKEPVPLFYGYYVSQDDGPSSDFHARHFPFAQWFAMDGGPMVEGQTKETIEVYHCAECERAKLDWISRHPESKWGKEEHAVYAPESAPRQP